jgi:hypothetical protein
MYGDVMDISWSLDKEKNYRVYFKKNDKIVRAAFNRRADFIYSISAYRQETLPADILYKVKETYFKKNIVSVIEVNISGKIAYMVNLEDKTSWLKIKVLNGEITEEGIYLKTT